MHYEDPFDTEGSYGDDHDALGDPDEYLFVSPDPRAAAEIARQKESGLEQAVRTLGQLASGTYGRAS